MNEEIRLQMDGLQSRLQVRAYVEAVRSCRHVWSDPVIADTGGPEDGTEHRHCLMGCGRAWWPGLPEPGGPEEERERRNREVER